MTEPILGSLEMIRQAIARAVGEGVLLPEDRPDLLNTTATRIITERVRFGLKRQFKFVLIHGPAGVGKTATLKNLAEQTGGAYIRCYPDFSAPALVRAAAERLQITQVERYHVLLNIVVESLRRNPRLIILDDIENIPRSTLGTAKYLADETKSTIVLCTMDEYVPLVRRYRDIESRIGIVAQAMPLKQPEFARLYAQSGFSPATLKSIYAHTGGVMRDIENLIRSLDDALETLNAEIDENQPRFTRAHIEPQNVDEAAALLNLTGGSK
ncbi:AAA family ATPase [Meiothermus ruber]|nr:AAA family ATPase [Meiothermus ruber]ADD28745.1 AAA ATPase [Meiothermus ruber DSM 1279]